MGSGIWDGGWAEGPSAIGFAPEQYAWHCTPVEHPEGARFNRAGGVNMVQRAKQAEIKQLKADRLKAPDS